MTAPSERPDPEESEFDPSRLVFRDKRRIDPETGAVRTPAGGGAAPAGRAAQPTPGEPTPGEPTPGDPSAALVRQLEERTGDLQRVKAEYDNYRRRVERDRLAVADQALASVLVGLLPVLDDIGRARAHGELSGGFRSVAEALEATLTKLGLTTYGAAGEPFDPTVHEALLHSVSAEVTEATATEIFQPGYRLGERILRPARVAVAAPGEPEPAPEPAGAEVPADDAGAAR